MNEGLKTLEQHAQDSGLLQGHRKPTVGRIVHYRLTAQDVETIERNRKKSDGVQHGNSPNAGEAMPMIVCTVWPREYEGNAHLARHEPGTKYEGPEGVNGQVLLDGNDSLWVTSAPQHATLHGCWSWPSAV